jgi:helicase
MEHETAFVDPPSEFDRGFEDWLGSLKTARVLMDWIDEDDREEIAERYDVGPGDIHTRVERSEWLLYAAESLAHVVDADDGVLEGVRKTHLRIEQGVREELLPLVQVRGVGRVRARRLYEAGIEDRDALRSAEVDRIARLVGPKTAVSILDEVGRDVGEDDVDASGAEAPRDESSQSSIGDF